MYKLLSVLIMVAATGSLRAQKMRTLLGIEGGVGVSVSQQAAFYPYAATGAAQMGQLFLVSPGEVSLVTLTIGYAGAVNKWGDYGLLTYNDEKLESTTRSGLSLDQLRTQNFNARLAFNLFLSHTDMGRPQFFIGGAIEGYILRQDYLFPITRTTVQMQTVAGSYQTTLGLAGRMPKWQYIAEIAYAPVTYYSGTRGTSSYNDKEVAGDFSLLNFKTFNAHINLQADFFIGKHLALGGRLRASSWRVAGDNYPASSLQNLTLSAAVSYAF